MANTEENRASRTKSKNKWNKENYDSFLLTSIPKGRAEEWAEIAKKLGYDSRNKMVVAAVEEMIERKRNIIELPEYGVIEITESVRYGLKIYRENEVWKIEGYEEPFSTFVEAERKAKEIGKSSKRYEEFIN